ncbi:aminopeptidase N-like [Dermacentor albipictus]|uniref:aminopeptidase N-like n=1 Tax=Dermacentor albipictus TaxID=60249 RepID=UPI0038FD34B0
MQRQSQSQTLLEGLLQEPPRPPEATRRRFLDWLPFGLSGASQSSTNSADHEIRNFVLFACLVSFVLLMSFFAVPNRSKAKNATQAAMQKSAPGADLRVAQGSVSSQTEQRATLPGNVIPVHYDLVLNVSSIEVGGMYRGRVNMVIDCVEKGSTTITAHAANVTVQEANISTYSGNQKISNVVINQRSSQPDLVDTVVFDLGFELVQGTVYNLTATFSGTYRAEYAGLVVRNYSGEGGMVTKIMTAHLWNGNARYAFPCFDDPALKATFNLTIVRDKDFETLSTWDLKNTTIFLGNERMDRFEMSVPITPSQLVFAVFTGLEMINDGYSKLFAIRYDLPYLDMALKSFVKMFDYMGQLLSVPLPFRKVHIIAIPDAKESVSPNWGLVILGAPTVAYDEESLNTQRRESILTKLAHVVAHQWFGNLVSSRQWDDVWLFEGLAFVFQRIMLRDIFQAKVSDSHFARRVADVLRAEDMKKRLSRPRRWLPGICDHPLLLRSEMIMDVVFQSLTTEDFVKSVATFLNRTRYRAASVKDLLLAFRLQNGSSDVADKMETWINNIGYPLVTVKKYAHRPGFKRLSQVSVCYGGVKCFNQSWQLPLHYVVYKRTGEITEGTLWLLQSELNFFLKAVDDDIVLFNKKGLGYYRVNYEQGEWTSIIKALHNATLFDSGTKLRLLDDIFKLADAGVTPYANFFAAALHVKNERDQNLWAAYGDIASYLDTMLLQSEFEDSWRSYNHRLLEDVVGDIMKGNNRAYSKAFQRQIMERACWYAEPQCILLARDVLNGYMTGQRKTVIGAPLPDGKLLCAAILHGSVQLWDMLWSKLFSAASLEHAAVPLDAVLHGLSCTSDRHRLWKLLNETTVSALLKDHRTFVMHNIAASKTSSEVMMEFLLSKWQEAGKNNTASIDKNVRDALFGMVSRNAKTTHEVSLLTAALATTTNNRLLSEAFTLAVEQRKHYTTWHRDHDSELVKAFAA